MRKRFVTLFMAIAVCLAISLSAYAADIRVGRN